MRRLLCALTAWVGLLAAWPATAASAAPPEALVLFNRDIVELRASLAGLTPTQRVARAQRRFAALSAQELAQPARLQPSTVDGAAGMLLLVGDNPVFTLLATDLDPEEHLPLAAAGERARQAVAAAARARLAQSAPLVWAQGITVVAAVIVGGLALGWLATGAHRRLLERAHHLALGTQAGVGVYAGLLGLRLMIAAVWFLLAAAAYGGAILVLDAFPWSLPWADRLAGFVRQLGVWLATGVMDAVPGLLTVGVVLLVARAVQEVLGTVLRHVQAGRLRVPFLHPETVEATRRVANLLLWGLALAAAYPYLPGAQTDAFKGLSVLFGLMITLGSTGVVTQLMSGLVVVYSRSLKKGDFIAVNGVEGVVSEVGALAVKVVNMRNEEITVPHSVMTSNNVHNYSKLAGEQGSLVSTKVTIGYDVPWRQVHAMLEAAAARTPGLRAAPPPFAYQRALGDYYVEYELYAHIDRPLDRVSIVSALHAQIQDEFNTHGVQIMSPHFYDQPAQPVVVPREKWFEPPARRPQTPPDARLA
jgi:small-conductance mechanosensitive channel